MHFRRPVFSCRAAPGGPALYYRMRAGCGYSGFGSTHRHGVIWHAGSCASGAGVRLDGRCYGSMTFPLACGGGGWKSPGRMAARQVAVSSFGYHGGDAEAETIRWYLEDYAEFPADPGARLLPAEAESGPGARSASDLFRRVFAGSRSGRRLGSGHRPGWARYGWRSMPTRPRRPACRGSCCVTPPPTPRVALAAGEFVRTHLRSAGPALAAGGGRGRAAGAAGDLPPGRPRGCAVPVGG